MSITRGAFRGATGLLLASICFFVINITSLVNVFAGSKKIEIAPFPVIYHKPETSLGLGAMAVITLREEDGMAENRPDSLSVVFSYTLKNQFFIEAIPDFYFNDQKGEVVLSASYSNMPTKYFGIGNKADIDRDDIDALEEDYSNESTSLSLYILHQQFPPTSKSP